MGKYRFPWRCFPWSKLLKTLRRNSWWTKTLILACICALWLIFVPGSSNSQQQQQREDGTSARNVYEDKLGHFVGLNGGELRVDAVIPTRPNVVYITLKARRQKPVDLHGTARPKLQRKKASAQESLGFTHGRFGASDYGAALETSYSNVTHAEKYEHVEFLDIADPKMDHSSDSSIRIYSQKPPPWFTRADVQAMRFLADSKVLRVGKIKQGTVHKSGLMFEGETVGGEKVFGVILSPADATEVFAFHLDRVLGLNRTRPAVSRRFHFAHENRPCSVVAWEWSSLSSLQLTWGQYQRSLKLKCGLKNVSPNSDCSSVHHHEWSRLALFDFLLQIHRRLDPQCCGFHSRLQDECERSSECGRPESTRLGGLIHHTGEQPARLLFTQNTGVFHRSEDNLDLRLLEGIKELPAGAVGVLRSGRLRERLLQSLFIDQTFWESQGGRQGIERLIDVVERRAQVLLTYITAHGISLTPMNAHHERTLE